MVNKIRTIYPGGLSKGSSSKFSVGSRVWHETPAKRHPKCCEYNNEDEDNSLSDKNYQASSQKFRWIIITYCTQGNFTEWKKIRSYLSKKGWFALGQTLFNSNWITLY